MTPDSIDLHRGRVLGGKYRLDEVIGRGGFGAVYRAMQLPMGREVAVKVILHGIDDPRLRARFLREARVLARLTDPAVITLYDYGEEPDGLLYMVQALVDGRSLAEVIDGGRRLEPARAVAIAIQVLHALEAAHRLMVVHRDIKPDNIMLTRGRSGLEAVRVLDFGIAKLLVEGDGYETTRGHTVGTPAFMAPEQTRAKGVGPATDLYALGVVLYRLLCGELPFVAGSHHETMMMHRKAPLPAMTGWPAPLAAVVRTALAKKPEDRFADAAAMRQALEAIAASGVVSGEREVSGEEEAATATVRTPSPVELGTSIEVAVGEVEAAVVEPTAIEPTLVEAGAKPSGWAGRKVGMMLLLVLAAVGAAVLAAAVR